MLDVKGLQIALTGKMRGGKDTVGKYLIEKYGFKRFAFGDGIVKETKKLFPDAYKDGVKPRKLLQEYGQGKVKEYKYYWVDALFREMLSQDVDPVVDNVVITDLRQPHEYEKLLESGFTIVRVNCSDEIRKQRILASGEEYNEETFNHITEQYVDTYEVDFDLDNNGTLEELFAQVDNMVLNLTGGGM